MFRTGANLRLDMGIVSGYPMTCVGRKHHGDHPSVANMPFHTSGSCEEASNDALEPHGYHAPRLEGLNLDLSRHV